MNAPAPVPTETGEPLSPPDLLSMYATMWETLRHEGRGIWERFNILAALNLALFGAVGLLCLSEGRPACWRAFGILASVDS